MGALTRDFDWSHTSIGAPEHWPASLRNTVSTLIRSKFPMFLWWGKDMVQFYNDAYRPSLGNEGKHPAALGQKGRDCWPEIWPIISPLIRQVETTGEATWMEDQLVPIYRNGTIEDVYWTYSYSSVLDEAGQHAGILVTCVETTEKVLNQRRITESERNLRNTILQAPVAMCILIGPEHVVSIANERMYELWGKAGDALLGKPIFEGLPEAKDQGFEELLDHVYTTGATHTATAVPTILPRAGKVEQVYVNFVYEAYREFDGAISGVMVVATDVTEQVVARRKMEEHEAELKRRVEERTADLQREQLFTSSILNASFNGIYSLKAIRNAAGSITDFQYLFVNDIIARMLQRKPAEIVGTSMLELIPENRTNGFFDLFRQVLETGQPVQDETHFVAQQINQWFDYIIVPIDGETVVVTIKDITEQKQATEEIKRQKEFLDTVVMNATSALLYCQAIRDEGGALVDFSIIAANDKAAEMSGFPHTDEFCSLSIRQVHAQAKTEDLTGIYETIVKSGQPRSFEYHHTLLERWYHVSVVKVGDGFLATITDISKNKLLQLQLEKAVDELRRSNQNLEDFAYAASHDLKEPIRKINFFGDRLKSLLGDRMNDAEKATFDRMDMATRRMTTLIDDLLSYSQLSVRPKVLDEVDLEKVVRTVLEDLDLEMEARKAVVQVGSLATVRGNFRQLQQVFQNLIGNALKYSQPGSTPQINIDCKTIRAEDAGLLRSEEELHHEFYVISVKDNGIGFEQSDAERIFNVFTRLHGNAEYKGTGIGLSIVRKVIENHKGFVTAESAPGRGSIFQVFLPKG